MSYKDLIIESAEQIYVNLSKEGIDVLIDDRDLRAGIKFKDADLLGSPVRVTVGMRHLKQGLVEMKIRSESESSLIPFKDASKIIKDKVKELYDSIK